MFAYALILLFIHYFVKLSYLNHVTSDMPLPSLFQIDLFLASTRAVPDWPLCGIFKCADVALCLQ